MSRVNYMYANYFVLLSIWEKKHLQTDIAFDFSFFKNSFPNF